MFFFFNMTTMQFSVCKTKMYNDNYYKLFITNFSLLEFCTYLMEMHTLLIMEIKNVLDHILYTKICCMFCFLVLSTILKSIVFSCCESNR